MLPALYAQMNDPSFPWGDYLVDDVAPVYTNNTNTSAAASTVFMYAMSSACSDVHAVSWMS